MTKMLFLQQPKVLPEIKLTRAHECTILPTTAKTIAQAEIKLVYVNK
jgi:hypothetical protein